MKMNLKLGDCLKVMAEMPDNSVDSIVTDPPYGMSFMNRKWDYDVPSIEIWNEAMRVLKPGGHLLSFAGARTYHRMAIGIEDAGFEIRDQIMWVYGSGFPKSHNIGKGIDKAARGVPHGGSDPTSPNHGAFKTQATEGSRFEGDSGQGYGAGPGQFMQKEGVSDNRILVDEAQQWDGWGTALKPAHEPIVVARKPVSESTVTDNVLKHGTGAINIDSCRIGHDDPMITRKDFDSNNGEIFTRAKGDEAGPSPKGRWPANIILTHHDDCVRIGAKVVKGDGHAPAHGKGNPFGGINDTPREEHYFKEEVVEDWDCCPDCPIAIMDSQSGAIKGSKGTGLTPTEGRGAVKINNSIEGINRVGYGDKGGASRFFYCAKASKKEKEDGLEDLEERTRGMSTGAQNHGEGYDKGQDIGLNRVIKRRNIHPTVKPIELMGWLIRLVTPPGGVTLDPFMGSGSTGIAAANNGFEFIGIEMDEAYYEIVCKRIAHHADYVVTESETIKREIVEWI